MCNYDGMKINSDFYRNWHFFPGDVSDIINSDFGN